MPKVIKLELAIGKGCTMGDLNTTDHERAEFNEKLYREISPKIRDALSAVK